MGSGFLTVTVLCYSTLSEVWQPKQFIICKALSAINKTLAMRWLIQWKLQSFQEKQSSAVSWMPCVFY